MDIHNFQLGSVFQQNAKLYTIRPVMAMKYQPGMENSWIVYFTNLINIEKGRMIYEGVKFFPTQPGAQEYINSNKEQYIRENGDLIGSDVTYDSPKPVLCREDADALNKGGIHFCFGERAFVSDELCDYEFYILGNGCWIIQDMDDIRVWYPNSDETFSAERKILCTRKSEMIGI